jgi:hypothetical protein
MALKAFIEKLFLTVGTCTTMRLPALKPLRPLTEVAVLRMGVNKLRIFRRSERFI